MGSTIVMSIVVMIGMIFQVTNDKETIERIQSMMVSRLDPDLPAKPIKQWIRSVMGDAAQIEWTVNDCGEQTGSPVDNNNDLPFCVGISARLQDGRTVGILVTAGTQKRGLLSKPNVFSIYIKEDRNFVEVSKLSNLKSALKQTKKPRKT